MDRVPEPTFAQAVGLMLVMAVPVIACWELLRYIALRVWPHIVIGWKP